MELTQANLDSIFIGYQTLLNQGLGKARMNYLAYTNVINSNSALEEYPFMELTGGMEKWIGDRKIGRDGAKSIKVINEDYSMAKAVARKNIRRDKVGLYNSYFIDMGIAAGNLWQRLAVKAMLANETWADGKPFFSSTRTFGKGKTAQGNKGAAVFSYAAYKAARAAMMSFADSTGEPLELIPDLVIVGPKYEELARKILFGENIVITDGQAAETNPMKGTAQLQLEGLLTGDNEDRWFLCVTSRGMKPVAVQKELEEGLVRQDQPNDPCVFDRDENNYGIHYSGNVALTWPQLLYGGGIEG